MACERGEQLCATSCRMSFDLHENDESEEKGILPTLDEIKSNCEFNETIRRFAKANVRREI